MRKYVFTVWTACWLLTACGRDAQSNNSLLKIMNSFSEDSYLGAAWPEVEEVYRKNTNPNFISKNVRPSAVLQRIKELYASDSLPNVLYLDIYTPLTDFLLSENLILNLSDEVFRGNLSKNSFLPVALISQGLEESGVLWTVPLTVHIDGIFFINEGLLQELGYKTPKTLNELIRLVGILKSQGYEYPLVLGNGMADSLFNTLLGNILGRLLGHDFHRLLVDPEVYYSENFRSALGLYRSLLADEGLFSAKVRSLKPKESVKIFQENRAFFLFGGTEDAAKFLGDNNKEYDSKILWDVLPEIWDVLPEIKSGLEEYKKTVTARVKPGYGITSLTKENSLLFAQSLNFINYMVSPSTSKIFMRYDKTFELPSIFDDSLSFTSLLLKKKSKFYLEREHFVPGLEFTFQDPELALRVQEQILNSAVDLKSILSLFYFNTLKRTF